MKVGVTLRGGVERRSRGLGVLGGDRGLRVLGL